ncbi:ATP-dependent zinc metalloprotease FtsH [Gossypium australe]|uniref:ATP-dependent zinc metalloprotease FtsH n=1 Tax=Gossypium australe TaxID=47621 RepID=A0A5B6X3I3_9ROSI|nr:ATP-dependent zinc metalloprotease FtsH [Gossypium australe]
MAAYEAEFLCLSRYAWGIVPTDHERCVRFEDGLRDELRVLIAPQKERNFATLVEKANTAEEKKPRNEGPVRAGAPAATNQLQPCVDCGKLHSGGTQQPPRGRGPGRGGNGVGRGQGAPGRGRGNTEARQPGLVYAVRRREDGDAPDVIIGTFLISDVPFTALIDIGSTHSYVACAVSGTLNIRFEISVRETTVISPLG